MSRPSEYTRNSIMKAAVALFAERGYDATSIRAIVSKARVNQAAINYHFKGKEGLYFEVLKVAFEGYLRLDNFDPERLKEMPREEALRIFVHQQLRPLLARDQMSRYIRIFAWENVRPSKLLTKFVKTGAMPFLASATELVRRFLLSGTSDQDAMCAAISLMGQCSVFVRSREQFAQPTVCLGVCPSWCGCGQRAGLCRYSEEHEGSAESGGRGKSSLIERSTRRLG